MTSLERVLTAVAVLRSGKLHLDIAPYSQCKSIVSEVGLQAIEKYLTLYPNLTIQTYRVSIGLMGSEFNLKLQSDVGYLELKHTGGVYLVIETRSYEFSQPCHLKYLDLLDVLVGIGKIMNPNLYKTIRSKFSTLVRTEPDIDKIRTVIGVKLMLSDL